MKKIAVAGNPNSGKSCIFNNLTGGMQHVGNYPGVTVEFVEGKTHIEGETVKVIDLPGTYSLTAYSQEEVVARDFILCEKPDVILNVVDASNLERNLYLTVQLIELDVPVVIALNMVDVAEKKGHLVNAAHLGALLGIKVIPTVGNKNRGMEELKKACLETIKSEEKPKKLVYSHELQGVIKPVEEAVAASGLFHCARNFKWIALKLLEDDEVILKELELNRDKSAGIRRELEKARNYVKAHSDEDPSTAVIEARYAIASGASKESTAMAEIKKRFLTEHIDSVVCNRFFGPLILLAVVYALFAFVFKLSDEIAWLPLFNGKWVSPTGLFEMFFDFLATMVENHVSNEMLRSLLRDGVIGGVGGVMGFVPLIFFMFLFIAFLEDSGYIARVAFILDRVMRAFGLQGKSILAMIVSGGLGGGGCAVPGVMATRTLREEKDRLVTILVVPMMNCGAKMPLYAMLIAAFFAHSRGAMMFLLWFLSWIFALCSAFVLRKWLVKGEQTPFVMELPVYHLPTFKGVMMHTWNRTWMYIKKAGTIILAINVILWAAMYFPRAETEKFEAQENKAQTDLQQTLAHSKFAGLFAADSSLNATYEFLDEYNQTLEIENSCRQKNVQDKLKNSDPLRFKFAELMNKDSDNASPAVIAFKDYSAKIQTIKAREAQNQLAHSLAGRLGTAIEPLSHFAGFDWRDNIALIGGFAAKEVVVGTLGTAYSMGIVDPEDSGSLSSSLAADPSWSPLRAFALMVFVMLYAPCFVTIAAIKKETGSWKWAAFSTIYSTAFGFVIAVLIYQIGGLFN